jgi:hypothetical protein
LSHVLAAVRSTAADAELPSTSTFANRHAGRRRVVAGRVVSKEAVERFAARSTKASAALEQRTVPDDFVRSAKVEKFLTERRPRA